jgi:hypothetical protein
MQKIKPVILILMMFILIFACEKEKTTQKFTLTKETITGKTLWDYITLDNNYKSYPMWPEQEGIQPGQAPHARFHKVYISRGLRGALPIKERLAPDGSIIVKENYSDDKVMVAYTVMAKVKGYDQKNNDWFWVNYTPAGEVVLEGKVDMCINCHASSNNNDFIMLQPLDAPLK